MATQGTISDPLKETGTAVDADCVYWEKHCAPILSSLLNSSGSYSAAEKEAQLSLLSDYVLPHLGPRPSKAHTISFLTQSGSPFQPSINFSDAKPRVRYCWEPLGPNGGSESDPFAVEAGQDIVSFLFKTFGFFSGWKDSLVSAFAPSPKEVKEVQNKLPRWMAKQMPAGTNIPHLDRVPFLFFALELKGAEAAFKAYINPKAKEIATDTSPNETTWDVLRNLKPALNPTSLNMVAEFLTSRPVPSAIELIGIDCVEEDGMADARIKLYVHTRNTSFNTVRDYLTLGGILQDKHTLNGLEALRKIWHLLLQEPEGYADDDYDKPTHADSMNYQKLYFSFELRPSKDLPDIKTYLPTWRYVRSDEETVQNYEQIFRICGQEWGQDGTYRKIFEDALYVPCLQRCPLFEPVSVLFFHHWETREIIANVIHSGPANHNRPKPVHCDASFLYSEKMGVYQTLYYSPVRQAED